MRVAITLDAEQPDQRRWSSAAGVLKALGGERATFFVQGRWARAEPALAREIADRGHLIGSHSDAHARMTRLDDAGLWADVCEAWDSIADATGQDPRPWFRCPHGAGHEDERVLRLLDQLGYRDVGWDVAVADWDPERGFDDIADDAVTGCRAVGDGAVLLLHTWPQSTARALERIIAILRHEGATFVTVDELDRIP